MQRLKQLPPSTSDETDEQFEQNAREADDAISEAEQLVRRMDLEARSNVSDAEEKQDLMQKLRDCKAEVQNAKKELREVKEQRNEMRSRSQLFASSNNAGGGTGPAMLGSSTFTEDDAREHEKNAALASMMQNAASIEETGDRIKQSKGKLIETEDLGSTILQDLHRQRETIADSRESLRGADNTLSASRKILQTMNRRIKQNKVILYAVLSLLFFAIIGIIYYKTK